MLLYCFFPPNSFVAPKYLSKLYNSLTCLGSFKQSNKNHINCLFSRWQAYSKKHMEHPLSYDLLHGLLEDLDRLYHDGALSREEVRKRPFNLLSNSLFYYQFVPDFFFFQIQNVYNKIKTVNKFYQNWNVLFLSGRSTVRIIHKLHRIQQKSPQENERCFPSHQQNCFLKTKSYAQVIKETIFCTPFIITNTAITLETKIQFNQHFLR